MNADRREFRVAQTPGANEGGLPSGAQGTPSEIAYRYDNESEVPTAQGGALMETEEPVSDAEHGRRERTAEL